MTESIEQEKSLLEKMRRFSPANVSIVALFLLRTYFTKEADLDENQKLAKESMKRIFSEEGRGQLSVAVNVARKREYSNVMDMTLGETKNFAVNLAVASLVAPGVAPPLYMLYKTGIVSSYLVRKSMRYTRKLYARVIEKMQHKPDVSEENMGEAITKTLDARVSSVDLGHDAAEGRSESAESLQNKASSVDSGNMVAQEQLEEAESPEDKVNQHSIIWKEKDGRTICSIDLNSNGIKLNLEEQKSSIADSDGVLMENTRKVNIPKKISGLEEEVTLHLAMTDEYGKRVDKYLEITYGKDGELKDMKLPKGIDKRDVKAANQEKASAYNSCYVQAADGKKYALPISANKFNEINKAIDKDAKRIGTAKRRRVRGRGR